MLPLESIRMLSASIIIGLLPPSAEACNLPNEPVEFAEPLKFQVVLT